MEKRFTIKDLVLLVLVVVLIISVWLAMKQYDRQWGELRDIKSRLEEQGKDVLEVQRMLASGVVARQGTPATGPTTAHAMDKDPFERIRASKRLPQYAPGGTLVDAFGNSVGKLTPLVSSDAYASTVQGYVLESLVDRDPDTLEWRPLLCSSWRIIDRVEEREKAVAGLKAQGKKDEEIAASKDLPPAIEIIFKLRPSLRFSDGTPLTVDDILFTYQWIMNPLINAPRERAYYERIKKLEKTAGDEVKFTFNEPYFQAFELAGGIGVLPKHFYGKYEPEKFNESVGLLLGSGPYRLESPTDWKPGTLIQVLRNDRYWGETGSFDRMVWREISNDAARLAAFRNGDIDMFPAAPEQYAQMIRDQGILSRTWHFEYQNPVGGYRYVAWNQQRGGKPTHFADVRVRRALTMLIDRKRLIDQVMLGYAVESTGPFNPLSKQYNPEVKPWPYDVAQAQTLLKQAGFEDRDGDGVIESAAGIPFRFKLTYPSGSGNYEKMVLFMKDAFARAGIALEADPLDWSVLVERLNKKNFEAVSLGWTAGIESDIYQMFHSSQTIEEGDNFMNYRSDELDKALSQARQTVNEDKRMALWREAHRVIHQDQPYTFLFFPKSLVFVDKRVQNVQTTKLGLNSRIEWFIPKAQQRTAQ